MVRGSTLTGTDVRLLRTRDQDLRCACVRCDDGARIEDWDHATIDYY